MGLSNTNSLFPFFLSFLLYRFLSFFHPNLPLLSVTVSTWFSVFLCSLLFPLFHSDWYWLCHTQSIGLSISALHPTPNPTPTSLSLCIYIDIHIYISISISFSFSTFISLYLSLALSLSLFLPLPLIFIYHSIFKSFFGVPMRKAFWRTCTKRQAHTNKHYTYTNTSHKDSHPWAPLHFKLYMTTSSNGNIFRVCDRHHRNPCNWGTVFIMNESVVSQVKW